MGRLRCSRGLAVDRYIGAFYRRVETDLNFPALSCDHAFAAKLAYEVGGGVLGVRGCVAWSTACPAACPGSPAGSPASPHRQNHYRACRSRLSVERRTRSFSYLNSPTFLSTFLSALQEKLPERGEAYLQFALLYTTTEGQRRVRVHTLALPITQSLGTAFRGADLDAYMSYVSRKVASQVWLVLGVMWWAGERQAGRRNAGQKQESSASRVRRSAAPAHTNSVATSRLPHPATAKQVPGHALGACKEAINKAAADALLAYRTHCASASSSGQLILPEALKLLPLYTLALSKHTVFRTDTRPDARAAAMWRLLSLPAHKAVPTVYARMVPLHTLLERPEVGGCGCVWRGDG